MAFILVSNITIGLLKRVKVNEVKITKSIYEYVDSCIIKVPGKARLVINNEDSSPIVGDVFDTAKAFNRGDKVTVELGYNGKLVKEFEGFISKVNLAIPVEIECEGYVYQLRSSLKAKVFKDSTLKEVLRYITVGTDITLANDIPDAKITKLVINGQSGAEVLEMLKKQIFLTIYFTGKELYAGLESLNRKADVKYRLGWNTIKDGSLKLHQAKNRDVVVNMLGQKKTGEKVKVIVNNRTFSKDKLIKTKGSSGVTGETKLYKTQMVTDEETLRAMAAKKHGELTYDGYEGKITAFIQPYCEPAYRAMIEDQRYPERAGNYLVNSTEVSYSRNGARRTIGIGQKL